MQFLTDIILESLELTLVIKLNNRWNPISTIWIYGKRS